MISTTTRNASLEDLAAMLQEQQTRKVDIVAPAASIRSVEGDIVVKGTEAVLTEDGVTTTDGTYRPTRVFDEGVADKLKVPLAYVRRLRTERPDLYDANVNGWLHGRKAKVDMTGSYSQEPKILRPAIPGDSRSFLLRCFRGDDGETGIARAMLSDRYLTVDNLDVLMAALEGVRSAGVEVEISGCDLTDRRMYMRITAPSVQALAPDLLRGYRSPFSGQTGEENPVLWAGFEIGNSEVGNGSFSITPRMEIQVCKNGMKITKDALRRTHIGSRLEEGVIRWSEDTQSKNLDLVRAQTKDAVTTFLDVDYMRAKITEAEEKAGKPVTDAVMHVTLVAKKMLYTEEQTAGILDHFIKGGQVTSGGVMHAITSFAQTIDDADDAASMEDSALRALETSFLLA